MSKDHIFFLRLKCNHSPVQSKMYPRLEEQSNDMKNISLAIHRRRRKNMFALTKCHKEVHRTLESIEVKTNSDEPFILYNESAKG